VQANLRTVGRWRDRPEIALLQNKTDNDDDDDDDDEEDADDDDEDDEETYDGRKLDAWDLLSIYRTAPQATTTPTSTSTTSANPSHSGTAAARAAAASASSAALKANASGGRYYVADLLCGLSLLAQDVNDRSKTEADEKLSARQLAYALRLPVRSATVAM
jgi:hypothetical protein